MTIQSITSAILAEAKAEAKTVLDEVSEEADRILRQERERLAGELEMAKGQIGKEAEKVYLTEMVKANFKLRNEELKVQRNVADLAFERTLERLHKQGKEERKKILQNLLKQAEGQMSVATVYVNSQDKALVGKKHKVGTEGIKGGLIAESKDGEIRMDLSFEAILADLKEEKIEAITSALRP